MLFGQSREIRQRGNGIYGLNQNLFIYFLIAHIPKLDHFYANQFYLYFYKHSTKHVFIGLIKLKFVLQRLSVPLAKND